MSDPYLGEIRIFAGNFAPLDWMFCDGQLLPISGNDALFNLIGTTYGGDGQSTFALPDLRGRLPVHQGNGFTIAETGGVETVTLTVSEIPAHSHGLFASMNAGDQSDPNNAVVAQNAAVFLYFEDVPGANAGAQAIGSRGGGQPHDNFQPYLCLNFIICMAGTFPSAV